MTDSTDPRRFLYRDQQLDPDGALRLTAQALKGCDDGELYLQYIASESFGFDDGRLKTADFNTAYRARRPPSPMPMSFRKRRSGARPRR
jgi:TldD protein